MTHNPFDEFAKSLVVERQAQFGHAETELELTRDALYADLAWEPDRALLPRRPRDLVDRMSREASLWEFSHRSPDFLSVLTCVEKLRVWHSRRVADAKAHGRDPPRMAPLWLICAGTPTRLRSEITFRAMKRWPRGFYKGPRASKLRLVLVRELHASAETLLLRLMGAGAVLRRAIADVEALPVDAEERILAERHIKRFERIRERGKEIVMEGKQLVAMWRAEHEAYVAGIEARGEARGLRVAVIAFCEAAGIALGADHKKWIKRADATALDAKLNELRATRVWT